MILIVEDEAVTRRVIESNLTRAGHPCVVAADGSEAIRVLNTRKDVSLVITDVEMPNMDGLAFMSELRSNREWSQLPVIVVSGHNELETVRKALTFRVRGFVLKPVVPAKLIESVAEVFAGRPRPAASSS
jgi:two-component system chemotaxis response regulator CheY